MTVDFPQAEYFEGDFVIYSVLIVNNISLEREFGVNVTVKFGEYQKYKRNFQVNNLSFSDLSTFRDEFTVLFAPVTGNQLILNVTVEDDLIVEDNDTLAVILSSEDPSVDVLTPLPLVAIIDEDGRMGFTKGMLYQKCY